MTITVMIATTAADRVMDIMGPAAAADIIGEARTGMTIITEMDADALISTTDLIEADITSDHIAGMMNTTGIMKIDTLM
jgi:hypothetical protein